MPNIYLTRLSNAIWDSDLIPTRITLFLAEVFWASMLIWSGPTFTREAYTLMALVMPEQVWAALFFITGIAQISIVLSSNIHSTFARYFAGWNSLLWLFTVLSIMFSVYPPPAAIGGELALTLGACWIWVRPYILACIYTSIGTLDHVD